MKNVKMLDCTLRDGGYVNDWNYGNGTIISIFDRLNASGTDIIEVGFLDDKNKFDINRSIQPDTASLSTVYKNVACKKSMVVAMIDYGTCDISNLQNCSETFLDGIRVIFKKPNMYNAISYGQKIIEKGYKLFLNMVSITSYNDDDIREFAEAVNKISPFAVSLVDTYGLMHKEQAFHYFDLLDKYLNPEIQIGYHSHNNFQLAYSNTIEVLNYDTHRGIIVDGTLYGMGKSAGNAPIELLAMYLNDNYKKHYDINQLLESINVDIMPIYNKTPWGYKLQFYISAKNNCHPNFVKYLMDKKTLSIKAVNDILEMISPEYKLKYDTGYIESLYLEYILDSIDDSKYIDYLSKEFNNKELLLLGPGKSIAEDGAIINDYHMKHNPITIALNFVPESIPFDYLFISNSKRYSLMAPKINNAKTKIIATSNITPAGKPFDYVMEYGKLISDTNEIWDNALVILVNLLRKINVKSVTLAGFDGFSSEPNKNYVDRSLELDKSYEYLSSVNTLLKKKINEYGKDMNISFLTKSIYE